MDPVKVHGQTYSHRQHTYESTSTQTKRMTETLLTYKVHINKLTDGYPINIIILFLILSELPHYRDLQI